MAAASRGSRFSFGEMKLLHTFCIWVSLALGFFIFIQVPITKLTTAKAVAVIEDHYLRQDMTAMDQAQYQAAKGGILGNQRAAYSRLAAARHLGLGACLVLLIHSIIGLRHDLSRAGAEPAAAPNGGLATPPGNSAVTEGRHR